MRISSALFFVLIVASCSFLAPDTTAKVVANRHVKPIIQALDNYRAEHHKFPKALADLCPKYLDVELDWSGQITERSDAGTVWTINYIRSDENTYDIWFYHAHYDVHYHNGKIESAKGNPFR